MNQQERIAQIASTSVGAARRMKTMQRKKLLSGMAFAIMLVCSAVYSDGCYASTFISLPLILALGGCCGVLLSLLLPKSLKLNFGFIVLFAALAISLFFFTNTYLANSSAQTVKVPILKKSYYVGRNATPYVTISYHFFTKKLSVRAPANVKAGMYVLLNIKEGFLGYQFIDSYLLVSS